MEDQRVEEELTRAIVLAERVRTAVDEAGSYKADCIQVGRHVDTLTDKLRSLVRFTSSAQSFYERPVRRVVAEVCTNLGRALALLRKCKGRSVLRRVVSIISAADFRKVVFHLEASAGDMKWLASVLDSNNCDVTLPPVASNDPILAWVWSSVCAICIGSLAEKIAAASRLAALAGDNDRNKKIIVEEGAVPPLLKLLNESASPEAQIAAATGLLYLSNEEERVRTIVDALGIPLIVKVLGDSPMRVQTWVARLVARMSEFDSIAQCDFARENAIRPLVTLLSFETFSDDQMMMSQGKQSIHSLVKINMEMEKHTVVVDGKNSVPNHHYRPYTSSFSSFHLDGGGRGGSNRKERENERPEVKRMLKISCAEALWMLARGNVLNSKRITETKGLLCLAKLVETEEGELRYNCLMTIEEITAAAEFNADLRRAAFRPNSPAAKAVVDQLLRLMKESDNPALQIPAVRSLGSLARTFPARENRVIGPLVTHLGNRSQEVAAEAAIALGKFACPDNFLHEVHSNAIVELNAVPVLMRLLRGNDRAQLHSLILLCYLALHATNNAATEQARLLTALEGLDKALLANSELRELVSKTIYHINLYHAGPHSQRLLYVH
ncbi:hypothetical protein Tsubulata_030452 [Turnera subulata]|uniref:DUF7792 domain-containing protein n=1 Tax=Turnera subulata TaxID=218843 RepID=A0A9Q0JJK9_9ROSI|nr:hypothetical protein Tsubulata_030452 [Turnera subulata]